ncbi:AIFM3 factor, partial [Eolophus roseicapillus]|nr:AIFM3 factor [Eolophus roseicapilla]
VLLVRNKKEFSALSSKCPHYGAPLSKGSPGSRNGGEKLWQGALATSAIAGVFRGERLRCPWHGACFNIRTGDIEEYPALDCLHCFKVTVEDGKVFVTAKRKVWTSPAGTKHKQHLGVGAISAFPICFQDLESSLRVKATSKRCPLSRTTVLLLGGGVAALVCAETLRQEGFTGRVIMATKEKHAPYDKSKLTKEMNLKAEDIYMRTPEFLHAHGIELWTEKEAVSVDFQKQKVHFMDGSSQKYNQLLIATGCHSSLPKVPGADLHNVCVLQTPEDSSKILELATGKNLVIIGASFIGTRLERVPSHHWLLGWEWLFLQHSSLELPSEHSPHPFQMLQDKGVKFYMKAELRELTGKDGKVAEAVLASGEKLPADVVLVGIGAFPNSAFLKGTSIARDASGAILVDLHMQTNIPNVFAAGDVVSFPVALLNGERCSIRHQQVAEAHGHAAALNMLKKEKRLHTIPFFWTTMFGKSIRYAGCGTGYTDTVVKGSLEQQKFLIFYIRDGVVTAAASLSCDPMVALIAEALYAGKQISKEEAE